MRYANVQLESWGYILPEKIVTSLDFEERLASFCKRLSLPKGFFEIFTGIRERRMWESSTKPSHMGILSARVALERQNLKSTDLDCLIHVSVTRDALEPATASVIHDALGMRSDTFFFDLSNACLGFLNGSMILANMIELGQIKRGILVGTEISTPMVEKTIQTLLAQKDLTLETAYEYLPTLTLGCGSAAFILSHTSLSKAPHLFLGTVARSASEFHNICTATPDTGMIHLAENLQMHTNANKLMHEAMNLAKITWSDFKKEMQWDMKDIQHIFSHQVGRAPREEMIKVLGADFKSDFPTFETLGNMGSVSLPITFAKGVEARSPKPGDHIALVGFGSGVNSIFSGVQW